MTTTIKRKKKNDFENDFGIQSMDDTCLNNSKMQQAKKPSSFSYSSNKHNNNATTTSNRLPQQCDNNVAPKIKLLLNQSQQSTRSSHFRMIVCGDSGIGKSALVHALSSTVIPEKKDSSSLEPIEVFVPETDTCIIDTSGYGALLRAEVVFSHVKSYIENQFEKTNTIFNAQQQQDNDRLTYIVYQSSDILTHVDACLYLIMGRLKPVDMEYMRSIHDLVNIIPVIIQPDLSLRPEIRIEQRLDILATLESNGIKFSYLGYNNYEELIAACKQPTTNPHCPPFMLDWSTTKPERSFHGLLPLKQALYQHQYKYLRYDITCKFIAWRNNQCHHNTATTTAASMSASSSAAASSLSSSSQEQLKNMNNIRISQYVTKRRHSMEREMLIQEKKLREEFEISNKQRRTELILKELNALVKEDLINKSNNSSSAQPMTHSPYWISLSILLSIFICYQNRNLIL